MARQFDRKIVLENGEEFLGYGFGAKSEKVCELSFDTSMAGYQEIISDPSNANEMILMTYPLIGNYGITDEDFETKNLCVGGLVVREYNDMPSNFRYTKTLSETLEENGIPGIFGVDTRKITRFLRENGSCKVIITDISVSKEEALKKLNETEIPTDLVSKVSCKKRWYSRTSNHKFDVVAIDCGMKLSTIRNLNQRGCNVTVVPYDISPEEIRFMKPDGILVSSGPGNPKDVISVSETLKALKGEYPVFGIGLGCSLLCLSYGADTYKLKTPHRGTNHPVRVAKTGKVVIVTENTAYAVCEKSLEKTDLCITHTNILYNTVEGVECEKDKAFAVKFYPDNESDWNNGNLFDKFIATMKEDK